MRAMITYALATATAAGMLATGTLATELKLGHFMSPKHPMHGGVFVPLAEKIKKESGGDLTIKIFDSGKLGKGPLAQYKRTRRGVFDIGFGVIVYTPDLFPKTMIAGRPGVGRTAEEVAKRVWSVYDTHLADEFKDFKVLGIWANWTSVLMSKKPIRKPSDLKGMIVRVSSKFDIPQIEAWGAKAEQIPVTQTYDALQKGTVDAVYIAPAALYRPWNLHEPASYVTIGMKSPASLFFLMVNKKSWAKLSAEHKAVIEKHTGREFSINASRVWGKADEIAYKKAKTQSGLTMINLSDEEAAAFDRLTDKTVRAELDAAEKKGIPARKIYDQLIQ